MARLFFDSAITGHHTEYISHLVDYYFETPPSELVIFVLPQAIKKGFPTLVAKMSKISNVQLEYISESECAKMYQMTLIQRAFVEYNVAKKIAISNKVDLVTFLYFNIVQFAFIFKRPPFLVTGILFLQFYRMQRNTLKDRLKYFRKYLVTKLFAKNKTIKRVFILNDDKTVDYLNKEFNTTIFEMLPDPIPELVADDKFSTHEYYGIPTYKKILLHIGALDDRKGTLEIIDAAKILYDQGNNEFAFVIAGKAKEEFDKKIKERLKSLHLSKEIVFYENEFLSNEKMAALFRDCDVVLMPYKNPEASSGILGHAVKNRKPVITPKTGLIGYLSMKSEFGKTISEITALEINKAIFRICDVDILKNEDFLDARSTHNFSKLLSKK